MFTINGAGAIMLAKTGTWIQSSRSMAVIAAVIFVRSFALRFVGVCLRILPQSAQ